MISNVNGEMEIFCLPSNKEVSPMISFPSLHLFHFLDRDNGPTFICGQTSICCLGPGNTVSFGYRPF